MKLKRLFLSAVFAVFIFLLIFFLNGAVPRAEPPELILSVSENILPGVGVFVLDGNKKDVSSIDIEAELFLQQRGLVEGTAYGFRIIDKDGGVTKPVYETFMAKPPDWIESNKYYHGLAIGNYTVELLTVGDGAGIIVARTNLSVFSAYLQGLELEKRIVENCSSLMSEPEVDADGWSRGGKIARCVAKSGAERKDAYACNLLFRLFNVTDSVECFTAYAAATGDISACDRAGMPKSRGFCRAKATKDWTECRSVSCDISCAMEGLETQQDLCIQWYAIENRNASLCNEIKSTVYDMKEICLNLATKR